MIKITQLFFAVILYFMVQLTVFAHAGVDHNKSCFLKLDNSQWRISGYQFQPEVEGKHFCHFFPELGLTVLALEPMNQDQAKASMTLELAKLTIDRRFTVIKQQSAQPVNGRIASIAAMLQQRGIYRLNVLLQDDSGTKIQQHFMFLVGFPVTKLMVLMATILLLILGCFGISEMIRKMTAIKHEP